MSAANDPASAIDIVEMTVERAQEGFASGAFTSESLTQAFLDRIAVYNPPYNAIVFMNPGALDDARSSDVRRASGKSLGPLDGVPVVVKDAMDMAGFPTTGGWRLLLSKTGGVDLYPATDAPVVARMRVAGAVILGKTNIPVLSATGSHANDSWAGPTYNAAGREFLPGGSSAGTATAVGASLAVLGLAEETGGSIQNPASAQGLVGIKPTFALVPNVGVLPLSSLRDVVGPIGRCVRDAALALDALAGFTMADPKTVAGIGRKPPGGYAANLKPDALRGKRIGTYGPGWRNLPLSEGAAALYRRALGEIEAQGAILVEDPFAGSGFADLRKPTVPGEE
jgi:amidase